MRLFVAIAVDRPIVDSLQEAVEDLRRTRAPVRWVRPEAIHLTLKFLGETAEDRIDELNAALKSVSSAGVLPFPMAVAGLGAFPSVARPRVIWAGVDEPSGSLARIYTALEDSMYGLGWDREKRRFNPHLTIGRVKGNINIARLAEAVRGLSDRTWGHQTVSDLTLYRSHLGPSGARYEVLRTFPLSPV